jgi:ABC-type lipoprotein release transport system permease subunit
MLFDLSSLDPATFVTVAGLLFFAALAACYVPARAATRVSPVQALRHE